jgi:hypothetical protein
MLLKLLRGLPVVPLMTYPCQRGYTEPYLGTLRSSWDYWCLLPEGVRSPRRNLRSVACYSLSQIGGCNEGGGPCCCPPCQTFGLTGGCDGLTPMGEWYGQLTHLRHTKVQEWIGYSRPSYKRDGVPCTLLNQNSSACLATGYVPATWRQIK